MLRAFLLASPFVLVAVVSCGDSSATFDDGAGGSAGTNSAPGGTGMAGTSSPGGKSASAGFPATNGGSNQGGQGGGVGGGSKGGQGGGNGGNVSSGGTKNNAGSANNGGTSNPAGGAGQGGASNGGTPTDAGGAANAGAAGSDAGAAGMAGMAGMAGNGPTGPHCPVLFGTYKIKNKDGMCGGLNKDLPQSIDGNTEACAGHFVSDPATGPAGVNGVASIDADGNFDGATLYLDKAQRSSCSGVWDAADETMTVTCGGKADMCTVLLELQ